MTATFTIETDEVQNSFTKALMETQLYYLDSFETDNPVSFCALAIYFLNKIKDLRDAGVFKDFTMDDNKAKITYNDGTEATFWYDLSVPAGLDAKMIKESLEYEYYKRKWHFNSEAPNDK